MLSCWVVNHELRPSFNRLEISLYNLLTQAAGFIDIGKIYLKPLEVTESNESNFLTMVIPPDYQAPSPPGSHETEDECLELTVRN